MIRKFPIYFRAKMTQNNILQKYQIISNVIIHAHNTYQGRREIDSLNITKMYKTKQKHKNSISMTF